MSICSEDKAYHRIFMGEAAISFQESRYKSLATDGLISCIGFAGYDYQKNIAFLVHFGGPKQVDDFYSKGIVLLRPNSCDDERLHFQCAIRGGWMKTCASLQILDKLKSGLISHPNVRFEIVEEDPPSEIAVSRSLAVNCANGEFSEYDSKNDQERREKTPKEEARDLTFSPFEELWYRLSNEPSVSLESHIESPHVDQLHSEDADKCGDPPSYTET